MGQATGTNHGAAPEVVTQSSQKHCDQGKDPLLDNENYWTDEAKAHILGKNIGARIRMKAAAAVSIVAVAAITAVSNISSAGAATGSGAIATTITVTPGWPVGVAVAGILAVSAASSVLRHRISSGITQKHTAACGSAEPVLFKEVANDRLVLDLVGKHKAPIDVVSDEEHAQAGEDELLSQSKQKARDPYRGRRQLLLPEVRKNATSWQMGLFYGSNMVVNGEVCEVKLEPRDKRLWIAEESLPLVGLAIRLDEAHLHLVVAVDESPTGEKDFLVELPTVRDALEMAVALKALRASADDGSGVADWGDRPTDMVKRMRRPPPAE